MRDKLAAFQRSRVGQFVRKVQDDRVPNLAILMAWGTLNTLLPLCLGMLALAGLVLRDPQRMQQLTDAMLSVVPAEAASTLRNILDETTRAAGIAGIISLVLLLFSGTNFFANMQMVFNLAYHVPDRNVVVQRLVALAMLIILTVLLVVSTTAYSLGNLIGSLPIAVPIGPVLGRTVGWAICIISALLVFLLAYKILPNKAQSWRRVVPGTLAAAVLFFVILQVFPLYLAIFGKGFAAYQAFGVFLLLMFWLYLLGVVMVAGAELNAFLAEPGRSTALASSKARAEKGQAAYWSSGSGVEAEATGSSSAVGGQETERPGPFGGRARRDGAQAQPRPAAAGQGRRNSVVSSLFGLAGMVLAVVLLRGQQPRARTGAHANG
jgi:membrane protein